MPTNKIPAAGLIEIEHPANNEGFVVSVPVNEPDPSLAGFPDTGYRGPSPESGHLAPEPEPWTPTPLDLTADKMSAELGDLDRRATAAQRGYDLAATMYQAACEGQAQARDFALTGVVDPARRKEIEVEHEAKAASVIGPHLRNLVANEHVTERSALELDQFSQRVGVSVNATPPQLPEALRSKASQVFPILKAEVDSLPLGTLRDRLRLALQTEDLASAYVLSTLLPTRLDAPKPATTRSDGMVSYAPTDDPARSELRSLVSKARERFKDRSLSELNAAARASRNKAGKLQGDVSRGMRKRKGQLYPFDIEYQRMTGSGPMIPWTPAQPLKPRPPTQALNPITGLPLNLPEDALT